MEINNKLVIIAIILALISPIATYLIYTNILTETNWECVGQICIDYATPEERPQYEQNWIKDNCKQRVTDGRIICDFIDDKAQRQVIPLELIDLSRFQFCKNYTCSAEVLIRKP